MRHVQSTSTPSHRLARRIAPILFCLVLVTAAPAAAAPQVPAANPAVISTWNQIAVSTATAGGASPAAFNHFAFAHLAMYNAVVGITGNYELYRWNAPAPNNASPEAAAAAAAHRVLVTYFPGATAALDTHLAGSLALVPDGGPQDKGIAYGVRAADHIIALRANDGRNAAVTVPTGTSPGHWQPEPGAFTTAWLGGVTPIAVQSATQFAPGPPPPITSATYLQDFNEVRDYGGQNVDTLRTADQAVTARFFSDAGIVPMQAGLRLYAAAHGLDIDDSARMFAAVETAIADGAITAWHAKLQYMWWRPVTAIRMADTDGNDDTHSVAGWMPLIASPPYPDWPSGLCSVVGAVSTVLERLNGDGSLGLTLTSNAAGVTRTYDTKAQITADAVSARVWSGIHFRTADSVSIGTSTSIANYVLDNYFLPTD
jgi:hypothetical protein